MKRIRDSLSLLLCLVVALTAVPATLAEEQVAFQVVVHSDNPTDALTRTQLSRIFLKKIQKWEHGLEIQPVDQTLESPVRDSFSKEVHGRSAKSMRGYWQRQIFSGLAVPPIELQSDQDVLEHVRRNPAAVGYVSSEARLEGDVKVLEIAEPD